MDAAITLWAAWVAFGLPLRLGPKIMAVMRGQARPPAWRAGWVMFYGGILVWSPFALFRKLVGWPVPLAPVLGAHFVLMYGGLLLQWRASRAMTEKPPPAPRGAGGPRRDGGASGGPGPD